MPRQGTGTLETRFLADQTRAFHLRMSINGHRESLVLHERPGCACGCGGGWDEPAARTELGNIIARVRAGVWRRPAPPEIPGGDNGKSQVPLYGDYAEWWLDAKVKGLIGDSPLSENTESDYRWRLSYSRAFFVTKAMDEIDQDDSLAFKAHLLAKSREAREALEAGADLRDIHGRRLVPLGLASIKKILDTFAAVLD